MCVSFLTLSKKLNAVHEDYCVLRLSDKCSYKIFNIYGKVLGTIAPNIVGEKGAYFDLDKLITDLSLEELVVITRMLDIVDRHEKQI